MKTLAIILLPWLAGLFLPVLVWGAAPKDIRPPSLEWVAMDGCDCRAKAGPYQVIVWAQYFPRHEPENACSDAEHPAWQWCKQLSQRMTRKEALKDCDRWMSAVKRALKRIGRT